MRGQNRLLALLCSTSASPLAPALPPVSLLQLLWSSLHSSPSHHPPIRSRCRSREARDQSRPANAIQEVRSCSHKPREERMHIPAGQMPTVNQHAGLAGLQDLTPDRMRKHVKSSESCPTHDGGCRSPWSPCPSNHLPLPCRLYCSPHFRPTAASSPPTARQCALPSDRCLSLSLGPLLLLPICQIANGSLAALPFLCAINPPRHSAHNTAQPYHSRPIPLARMFFPFSVAALAVESAERDSVLFSYA